MLQDIQPRKYTPAFKQNVIPAGDDKVLAYSRGEVVSRIDGTVAVLPSVKDYDGLAGFSREKLKWLFSIDSEEYFWLDDDAAAPAEGFQWNSAGAMRTLGTACPVFAAALGMHISHWYKENRYCGRCGSRNIHKPDERALLCPECGQVRYPRINPVAITAVTDGDRILLARYNPKHMVPQTRQYVLLAGYVEAGESFEQAVVREIREETGLTVHNVRYAASQPWPYSDSIIAGFYAEADSSLPLQRQEDELSELVWLDRAEVPPRISLSSVTDNLVEWFRLGKDRELRS